VTQNQFTSEHAEKVLSLFRAVLSSWPMPLPNQVQILSRVGASLTSMVYFCFPTPL
jgi:hypothetical protein